MLLKYFVLGSGQTGAELTLVDPEKVLSQLSAPEGPYMRALRQFPNVTFVASPHYDHMVPFCTSAALPSNPHPIPAKDAPRLFIARHSGFPESYHSLFAPLLYVPASIDGKEQAAEQACEVPVEANMVRLEDPSVSVAGNRKSRDPGVSTPLDAEASSVRYEVDSYGESEFLPQMIRDIEAGVPQLRRLEIQAVMFTRVLTHALVLQKFWKRTSEGLRGMRLIISVIERDLKS